MNRILVLNIKRYQNESFCIKNRNFEKFQVFIHIDNVKSHWREQHLGTDLFHSKLTEVHHVFNQNESFFMKIPNFRQNKKYSSRTSIYCTMSIVLPTTHKDLTHVNESI